MPRIDSLWALKWTKVLNHSAVSLYEYPTGVDVSSQGDIYVSVHPMTYSGGVVHRISPSGAIKSSRLISGVPRSVLVSDTNLFVCGYAGNQGFVTRMMLGLGHVSTKSHTFGSNSSAGFWKLHAGGSGLQGFGFAYGNTRLVATEMAKVWADSSFENYTFNEKDGKTELVIDLNVTDELAGEFEKMWPDALQKLKEISER